jgi:hypothetical protein
MRVARMYVRGESVRRGPTVRRGRARRSVSTRCPLAELHRFPATDRLPGDADSFAAVAAVFQQVGDRDCVVLGADLAVAVLVNE